MFKQPQDLGSVTVEVKPEELQPLLRIEGTGKEMRKDHLLEIQSIQRRPKSIEHRLAGFRISDPILQRSADMGRGDWWSELLRFPSASYDFIDR